MAATRSLIRIGVNVALDGVLAAASVPLARWIAAPAADVLRPLWMIPAGAAILLLAGLPFRLSLQYWRFAGLGDLLVVGASSACGAALFALLASLAGGASPNPAFPLIHALTLLALLGAPRVGYRQLQMQGPVRSGSRDATSILLVGEGEDADLFLRALAQDRRQSLQVECLLALSPRQVGRRIQGHTIRGALCDLRTVLERLRADDRLPGTLVIATPDLPGTSLAAVVEQADRFGLRVRRAPRPTTLDPAMPPGRAPRLELKPVAIEDLLNRPQVPLDRDGMARLIQGRRVVVTGAGGTIGSELARQVAAFGPSQLVLLDNGEYALWQIDLELAERHSGVPRQALLADVRDEGRIRSVFEVFRPELVFHAAALKHVPMVESNPLEGLMTNAAGTRHVADAARAVGALAMVLISTDKAVNPSSVMGASKRLAEMYCQGLDLAARPGNVRTPADAARTSATRPMRCITVRFGNVLGSTGSVVPLFQRQLARGGPLTVTHPDMRRYFMTVREAVSLVLQASVLGVRDAELPTGLDGGIFVLDMGEPVKIVDLARQMIRLAGLHPDEDVEIRFTGLRPGEKLFEELFHGKEPPVPTGHPGLLMAMPRTA
ncbi:MAG: nucleoside-diphosphate sugar epimerase/dehydratase, partial [Acetobacteraceae bacterium]|nr:nucleoside-diphosphate sugar epimerase/dehydratase [Acetobacteraceae bacterium]